MNVLIINGEYIKLEQALKLSNVASTGGEAKLLISSGDVLVNGVVERQRGKKLRAGDTLECMKAKFVIKNEN